MFERIVSYPCAVTGAADPEALVLAAEWLTAHTSQGQQQLLYVPLRQTLDHDEVLMAISKAPSITTATPGTLHRHGPIHDPAMAVWVDQGDLDTLISRRGITALVVVPANVIEIKPWIRGTCPERLGDTTDLPIDEELPRLDPVVNQALNHATLQLNQNNNITGGTNKDVVVSTLLALKRAGYTLNPGDIHAHALHRGWRPDNASELAIYVRKVNSGVRPKVRPNQLVPNVIDLWQEASVTSPDEP